MAFFIPAAAGEADSSSGRGKTGSLIVNGAGQEPVAGRRRAASISGTFSALSRITATEAALRDLSRKGSQDGSNDSREIASEMDRVLRSSMRGTADPYERGAATGQLWQTVELYEDVATLAAMKQQQNELGSIAQTRITGLLHDASQAGDMVGAAATPLMRERALLHYQRLVQAATDTVSAVSLESGEAPDALREKIQQVEASLGKAFITGVAVHDPELASMQFAQLRHRFDEDEAGQLEKGIGEAGLRHAELRLLAEYSDKDGVNFEKLQEALQTDAKRFLPSGLPDTESLKNRLEDRVKMRKATHERSRKEAEEKSVRDAFLMIKEALKTGNLDSLGPVVEDGWQHSERNSSGRSDASGISLPETLQNRIKASLQSSEWEQTDFSKLSKLPDFFTEKHKNYGHIPVPGDYGLSRKDTQAVWDMLDDDKPDAELYRQQFVQGATLVRAALADKEPDVQGKAISSFLHSMVSARKRGADIFTEYSDKEDAMVHKTIFAFGGRPKLEHGRIAFWGDGGARAEDRADGNSTETAGRESERTDLPPVPPIVSPTVSQAAESAAKPTREQFDTPQNHSNEHRQIEAAGNKQDTFHLENLSAQSEDSSIVSGRS